MSMWTLTPGPYTDAFRLLREMRRGPRGHPSAHPRDPSVPVRKPAAPNHDPSVDVVSHHGVLVMKIRTNTAFAREFAYSSGRFNSHLSVVSVFDLESWSNSTCIHEYEMYASSSLCLNGKRSR